MRYADRSESVCRPGRVGLRRITRQRDIFDNSWPLAPSALTGLQAGSFAKMAATESRTICLECVADRCAGVRDLRMRVLPGTVDLRPAEHDAYAAEHVQGEA